MPMYKDKPFQYPTSSRKVPWYMRRRLLAAVLVLVLLLLWLFGVFSSRERKSKADDTTEPKVPTFKPPKEIKLEDAGSGWFGAVDWDARAENVKEAFRISWSSYEQHGWGKSLPAGPLCGLGTVDETEADWLQAMMNTFHGRKAIAR